MRHLGNRTITVIKSDLINQIENNKEKHVNEYNRAVELYKIEALRQLEELKLKIEQGEIGIKLNLVTPVNNSDNYDRIIEMFEWEVKDTVDLTQNEFLEYVQDETDFSIAAKLSNSTYSSQRF